MSVKLDVKIDKQLVKAVTKKGSRKAVFMALDHLAAVSKQEVPLDQGPLMNSCYVDVNADGTEGTISYDTPYAVVQHEATWYQHQRGRKAKYLEDPVNNPTVQHQMLELAQKGFEEEI